MSTVLAGLDSCDVIMDDIIVRGKDENEHDQRLEAVMKKIENCGMQLNKKKCQIRKKEVPFFGHTITKNGIQASCDKIKAIISMLPPNNVTELRSLCGMFNYLTRFARNLATTIKPITELLRADV